MSRVSINDVLALKELADTVRKEVDDHVFHEDHIESLADLALHVVNGLSVRLMTPKEKLYETIKELYPSGFGRNAMAEHFVELLEERYHDGINKEGS